jgi:cupin fold WbuC family metalloprotein
MQNIYSKVDTTKLLHVVVRKEEMTKGRSEIIPADNFIQCSMLNLDNGHTFRPHKHIWKERTRNVIAQESWVVIQGSVRCTFYDIDDTVVEEVVLTQGDSSFTLEGGHNYFILEDNTLVYEYKTGPYEGQENDKRFLNGV